MLEFIKNVLIKILSIEHFCCNKGCRFHLGTFPRQKLTLIFRFKKSIVQRNIRKCQKCVSSAAAFGYLARVWMENFATSLPPH